MKKSGKIITASIAALALVVGVPTAALAADKKTVVETPQATVETETQTETITEGTEVLEEKLSLNDEVAYVFTNYDGSVDRVMDSVWIEDGNDVTENGDEANLPIDLKITYKLDGKEMTPTEMSGKSGHLTVDCNFVNNTKQKKVISGREEDIYVPFLASLITVMDDESCKNVEISSGKVTYDGSRYAIVGLAFPGLNEDLGDSANDYDLNIPDSITIDADVTDYEPTGFYVLVSNSVFNSLDIDSDEEMNKLGDAMSQLTDAINQLMDGSSQLYAGLGELETGATQLSNGVTQLSDGLAQIDANSAALNDGALQVFNSLLNTATQQINAAGISMGALTVDNYGDQINAAIAQLGGIDTNGAALSKVEGAVRGNADQVRAAVTQTVKAGVTQKVTAGVEQQITAQVTAQVLGNQGLTEDQYNAMPDDDPTKQALAAAISSNVEAQMASQTVQDTIDANVETQMASAEVQAIIDSNTETQIQNLISSSYNSADVQGQIAQGNATIQGGIASLQNLKSQLDSYNQFYQGVRAYTSAVGTASSGAGQLKAAMPELLEGISALKSGQGQLSDGLQKFDTEGIGKINDMVENNLEGMVERTAAMSSVSKEYNSYNTDGTVKDSVKFVYKVSAE